MQWVFETLGIDKQADASAVRKAYAKAIKQCDQVTEADRFQRIRQAYEFALQWAKQREASAQPPAVSAPITQPIAKQSVAQQPAAPPITNPQITSQQSATAESRLPAAPAPVESQPLAPQPNQPPYTKPASAPPAAFTPSAPQPIAPKASKQRSTDSWQAPPSPVESQPLRPRPVVAPPAPLPPPLPPIMRASPLKAHEWIPEPTIDSSVGYALPTDDAQASAKAVLKELLIEVRRPNVLSVAGVLGSFTNDVRLTSLDAKAEFEQALLVHIFSGPVDVSLLDAACDLFAWETSNRHFVTRANLVQRVLRHQSLRHVLAASKNEDRRDLDEAVGLYKIFQQQPKVRVEPWQIVNTNRLLARFGGFKQELGERYNAEAFDWWRQMLASNPTLLASYQENKPAQQAPQPVKPRRSQQTTRQRGGLYLLWPILAIIGAIAGHLPSSPPSYGPSQDASPTHASYQQPSPAPQLPPPPTNDPYLMDIDALRQSAEQGNPTAQSYLGVRYEDGNGVAKSTRDAAYWYRLAAERGFPEAQFRLGELYKEGNGVPQNTRLALEWWKKAANNGHALAQNSLGEAYAKGEGIQKDYQAARRWWQGAAFHNDADAEVGLGWLYANGYGIPRDAKTAVDWYRKAAAQGDIAGQVDLALMFDRGEGVPADPVIADALLTVATEHQSAYAQGGPGWADLDRISAHFTPAQQSAASQIARDLSTSPGNFLAILDTATRFRHRMQQGD